MNKPNMTAVAQRYPSAKQVLFTGLAVTSLVFLSGCSQTVSSCPPLAEYTHEQNADLHAFLETLPYHHIVFDYLTDYDLLREQVRACQ